MLVLLTPLSKALQRQEGRVGALLNVTSTNVVLMRALWLCKNMEETTHRRNILFKDTNSLKTSSLMI